MYTVLFLNVVKRTSIQVLETFKLPSLLQRLYDLDIFFEKNYIIALVSETYFTEPSINLEELKVIIKPFKKH